jgi:hypothetical protein
MQSASITWSSSSTQQHWQVLCHMRLAASSHISGSISGRGSGSSSGSLPALQQTGQQGCVTQHMLKAACGGTVGWAL